MAASGAKVLQLRSVEYARTHGVRIHCRSSFEDGPGTVVLGEDETMEHPLDHRGHALDRGGADHAARRARPARRGRGDLRRARRRQLQHRHDHPERAARGGPRRRGVVHALRRGPARPPSARSSRCARSWGSRAIDTVPEIGKVSIVGAGMRSHPGVAAQGVRDPRGEDINIEMISTSPIKISCVIRAEDVARGGPRAARRVRARRRRRPRGAPDRPGGAVSAALQGGRRRRHRRRRHDDAGRCCASADFPASEIVPFASERSAGRELDGTTVRALTDGRRHRAASTSRCSRPALRAPASGRRGSSSAAPTVIDNSSAFRRDPDDPAGRLGGQPARAGAPPRPDRQPQLLDDADGRRARADPSRGRDRAARRRPRTSPSPGPGRRRSRSSTAQAHASLHGMEMPAAGDLSGADRVQRDRRGRQLRRRRRPHRRGAQDDVRDAQDPRGRVDRRGRHVRPGAGADRPLGVAVNIQTREPLSAEEARELLSRGAGRRRSRTCRRRCGPRDATRCSSAGSADDDSHPRALSMWVVGDNLRKGAATNAIQIARGAGRAGPVRALAPRQQLAPRPDAQLAVDPPRVRADGLDADVQLVGDLAVRLAGSAAAPSPRPRAA